MLFRKKLEPQTVEERSSVTMEVELTRPWPDVKWTRNAAALAPGKNVEIHAESTSHRLVLHCVGFADRGFYGCETPDDKTQAKLTVEREQQQQAGPQESGIYEGGGRGRGWMFPCRDRPWGVPGRKGWAFGSEAPWGGEWGWPVG